MNGTLTVASTVDKQYIDEIISELLASEDETIKIQDEPRGNGLSGSDLIELFKKEDTDGKKEIEKFIEDWAKIGRRYFLNDAELVQERINEYVSKLITNGIKYFDSERRLSAYLATGFVNSIRDYLRKEYARMKHEKPESVVAGDNNGYSPIDNKNRGMARPSSVELVIATEESKLVTETIGKLKPVYRQIIRIHYFDELTHTQISEIMGISLGTVKSRVHNALNAFEKLWKKTMAECAEPCYWSYRS